ncbi:carbon starvation protein A [Bacteroidetes/Chlorobi group bacterium Naka2016]|jgi:carbon starvation protein|nr:MAG: carbon starvation protein A [Bacteroidetes/Chlorobi group bacterium Naka2016]
MNTLFFILFGIAWFIFAYYWYGNIIKNKVLRSTDQNPTPSHTLFDNKDYVPTKPIVLFGHHFSAIAGAGPIIGPILAYSYFGWLPALLWILLGSVFIGAVHDYTSLITSVRNKGFSLVNIADKVISPRAGFLFSIFVFLTLLLVLAVFSDLTARTLMEDPTIVVPTIGLIFVALLFGVLHYRLKVNVYIATFIALVLLVVLLYLGHLFQIKASYGVWLGIILAYCFIAAILPVWLLLQPRDYIAMYILVFGMTLGYLGMIFLNPKIQGPQFIGFLHEKGPLFPMLFITIACGAISGFHSLIASGTSAKQLDRESQGKIIAYGGMLTEGALAFLVIMMVASVLPFNGDPNNSFMGILTNKNADILFGNALGLTLKSLGIPVLFGTSFGILMLNAFILTSLDAGTRLCRYIVQEGFGERYGGLLKDKYFSTAIIIILTLAICLSGSYNQIWSVFGAANQLIGTLALFVVTSYLLGIKAPKLYTLIPALFMLVVTESALIYQLLFIYLPKKQILLLVISTLLIFLGIWVAIESLQKIFYRKVIVPETANIEPIENAK